MQTQQKRANSILKTYVMKKILVMWGSVTTLWLSEIYQFSWILSPNLHGHSNVKINVDKRF